MELKEEDETSWLEGKDVEAFKLPYETELMAKNLDRLEHDQLGLFD